MRKRTFLKELRNRLENSNCNDVDDVIQYYDELIEDTIDRTNKSEDDVVYDLGPISEIVARVTNNRSQENNYFEKDNKIHYDELDEEPNRNIRSSSSQAKRAKDSFDSLSTGIKILIGIVTMPVWFSLLVAYIGIIIAMVCTSIGLGVGAVACIMHGIAQAGIGNSLFEIGLGVLLFGLTLVVVPLVIKIVSLLIKLLVKFIKWLFATSKEDRR